MELVKGRGGRALEAQAEVVKGRGGRVLEAQTAVGVECTVEWTGR